LLKDEKKLFKAFKLAYEKWTNKVQEIAQELVWDNLKAFKENM
jgi:hypothetical protein